MFDPRPHLIQLPRRVKDVKTGQYTTTYDDYLEVKWRVVMFRERYPHGVITTEEICVDLDRGYARYKATVQDGDGGVATGYGTEMAKDFADYVERAETRALGRALALLGFGTQFVGQDLTEGEHVVDSPVATAGMPINTTSAASCSHEQGAGSAPHPSADDIDRLFAVAESCREPKEVLGSQLRRIMALGGDVRISKKFLRGSMTMEQFDAALAYYETMLRRQVEEDVPDGTPPTDPPVPESTHPSAGSFAEASTAAAGAGPSPDDSAARDALVREAMSLGLPEAECRHVVTMHTDLEKARSILTAAARRKVQAA